jgi:hypothetical protein
MAIQKQVSLIIDKENWTFKELPEAASQSFSEGDLVYLVNGKVTVLAADSALFAGVAMQDASGTVDTLLHIAVPKVGATLRGSVSHTTAASAITAITQRGARYPVVVSSGNFYVDIENSGSNDIFLVEDINLPAGHAVGDRYGQVIVSILDEINQLAGRDNA